MQTTTSLSAHDPDGVPHEIVGLTWVLALGAALASFAALTIGGAVFTVALLFVPAIIISLGRRAARTRETPEREL